MASFDCHIPGKEGRGPLSFRAQVEGEGLKLT